MRLLTPQRRSFVRGLRRWVTRDMPLKGAAVGLAVASYLLVTLVVPREVVAPFDGRIPVEPPEVPSGFSLRGPLGDVSVRLRGPEPVVARIGREQLRATLDISALDTGKAEPQDAPVRVAVADPQVTVVDVTPATVAVRIEPIISRTYTVQARFANEPPAGFQRGEPQVTPAEVQATAPASVLGTVAAVYAAVRFGDIGVDLVTSATPVPVDAAGAVVDGVTVEPAAVQVKVPVLSTSTTRTLAVLHDVRGVPANGYWIVQVVAEPAAITVRGPQEAIARLDVARTAPFDVTGINGTRTFQIPFALPQGVEMLEPRDAQVTVNVQVLTGTRPFPLVAVVAAGLADTLVAEVEPRTIGLVLTGPVPALAAVAADQVTATVDVTGRGPGTYALDVAVRVPAGVVTQQVQPARVTVTIRNR
ncbi:MAG TPA: CdaR family protein [Candidatus Limnocylindria bacterium]|nr:CdaR family protein [Candidatus Limnocylindria bacterium]